jgi:hypothetical protein
MPAKHSVAVPQQSLVFSNRPENLNIPQYHILILAWCALVILYGGTDSSPPFQVK